MGRSNINIIQAVFFFYIFFQNAVGNTLQPTNTWVFEVMATSTISQKQNGFRYTLPSTSTQTKAFDTRAPSGSFYELEIGATIYVGGCFKHPAANYWLQNVRMYLNYFPNSVDEMLNLAIMDTGSINHALNIPLTSLML